MTPTHIILHHSLTKDSETVSWGAIRRYHMSQMGMLDIGYQFGVELVDHHHEILIGRLGDRPGAHTRELGMNHHSVGICVVGDFDEEPPPVAALDLLQELVRHLQKTHSIPTACVLGHREVGWLAGFDWRQGDYKSCPGGAWNMADFRRSLDT